MRKAWLQVNRDPAAPSFQHIHTHHNAMLTVD